MKKSLLILLYSLSVVPFGYTQNGIKSKGAINKVSNVPRHDTYIYFDGYEYNPVKGIRLQTTRGVMDTRIFDILDDKLNNPSNLESFTKTYPDTYSGRFIPNTSLLLGIKYKPQRTDFPSYPVKAFSKNYSARFITDGSAVELMAMGIDGENFKDYRFRVVENDSAEIIPWKIPQLQQKYGAKKEGTEKAALL